MTAQNATTVLLVGFDLANAILADESQEKWVRVNVLLGAKRHKRDRDIRSVVQLLANELQRSKVPQELFGLGQFDPKGPPAWWQPSEVVGFDLSGDENSKMHRPDELAAFIETLDRESAPITIHAGESASAESIWEAVFLLGARRIGHGLRLREQPRLLEHCVTRRICMELCPISNAYTGGLTEANEMDRKHDKPGQRWLYPIVHYLNAGMDVCINTDNRFLHPAGQRTVTAEYMKAAELTGYLTKAEVLSIVCAGFRNAFLDEMDLNRLLAHVEDRIYPILVGGPIRYD